MHAGLSTCNFDQCWEGGDKAMMLRWARNRKPRPPAVINTAFIRFAEEVTVQRITNARGESASRR